jgi:prepilin-type N-terminal cleavage/methylation domain-containing protein
MCTSTKTVLGTDPATDVFIMDATPMLRRLQTSKGFTLVELLVVVSIIGVVAAIATPGLLRSRVAANEASAIASLRGIVAAQQDFGVISRGYADDLATLAGICPGANVPFISPDLSANGVEKSGYTFVVTAGLGAVPGPNDCFGNATQTTYYATATPLAVGSTGTRGFASNIGSAIWQDISGAVPAEPFTLGGTVSPLGK